LVLLSAWACEHDPEIDREGGPLPDASSGGTAGDSGVGGQAADAGADGAPCPFIDPAIITPALPCDVEAVLKAKCQRCHQNPPLNGAPFPLLTWENTQAIYFNQPIYARMLKAVSSGFMPYKGVVLDPPVEPLTDDEKATLIAWLSECGPPAEKTSCPP
jgi:hypothetical protein